MMINRLTLLLAGALVSLSAIAQNPRKVPAVKNNAQIKNYAGAKNLLDASSSYKLAPINFVAFNFSPELQSKGHNANRIYTWTTPDGVQKTATGAQILEEVNNMEKDLNMRGHTLRNRYTFTGVGFDLRKSGRPKVPKSILGYLKDNKPQVGKININNRKIAIPRKRIALPPAIDLSKTLSGDVFLYFGKVTSTSGEFQGSIYTEANINNVTNPNQCPLDFTIALPANKSVSIGKCVLELSKNSNRQPNANEAVVASVNFNFNNFSKSKNGNQNIQITGDAPPSNYILYSYNLMLNDLKNKMPAASKTQSDIYYAYLKMYNTNNELIYYSSYNIPVLNNIQMPPVQIVVDKFVSAPDFSDEFTDPAGLFGIYYTVNNVKSRYSKIPNGWEPIRETAELSANVEIGAQYYNFWHLLDNNAPRVEKKPFLSAKVSSKYLNVYPPDARPAIRIPGSKKPSNDMNGFEGYDINYTLLHKSYNKNSSAQESESIGYNLLDKHFFIGPVPCNIKVDISGTASMYRQATMDTLTNGNVSLFTRVIPHLDLTVTGQGGVNASIAYAMIVTDVKVISADLPIELKADATPDINAALKVSALSGRVYMKAGICIPIPFTDDLCKEFVVNVFDWTGPTSNYTIIP